MKHVSSSTRQCLKHWYGSGTVSCGNSDKFQFSESEIIAFQSGSDYMRLQILVQFAVKFKLKSWWFNE